MSKLYFGKNVDEAILSYKKSTNKKEKNKIFEQTIMPAFEKLIEYHYYKVPVVKNPEIKQDCLVMLYEKIENFDETNFDRGFPYFNMVVRHFFFQELKKQKKQIFETEKIKIDDFQDQTVDDALLDDSFEVSLENKEFVNIFKDNLQRWRSQFQKEQEVKIIDALIVIFESCDDLLLQKKAIFHYLKELTGLNSKQIASNLNKIKKRYELLKTKYSRGDI